MSTQLYIPEIEEAIVYIEGVPTDLTEELLEEVLREILYEGVIITEIQMISKSRAAMVKFEKLAGMLTFRFMTQCRDTNSNSPHFFIVISVSTIVPWY